MTICETCTEGDQLIIDRLDQLVAEQQQLQSQVQALQDAIPHQLLQAETGQVALIRQVSLGDLLVAAALTLAVVFLAGDRVYRMLRGVLR